MLQKTFRFAKFCIVGFSGVIVNLGILYLLKQVGFFYLASVIAIEASILTNFLLNDTWTFQDKRRPGKKSFLYRLIKWNIARGGTSLIVNFGIFTLLTSIGVNYLVSQFIGIVFATLLAYVLSLVWVWK